MQLEIERWYYPELDPETFRFNETKDPECKAHSINSTHVIMRTPLGQCGTRYNRYADLLTFYNGVDTEVYDRDSPISRYPSYMFLFECAYFATFRVSLNAFTPVGKIIARPRVRTGNFSFKMDMFQTGKYFSPYTKFPVRVRVGERVFLKIKVKTNASDLVLFLDQCKATPTPDVNSEKSYLVLKNGCPIDRSMDYKYTKDREQRFSFKAFRFINQGESSEVYLHCEVILCHKANNASRCNQACTPGERPRYLTRREITSRDPDTQPVNGNLSELLNLTARSYDVSLGPFKVYLDLEKSRPRPVESGKRSSGNLPSALSEVQLLVILMFPWLLYTRL
ncbi:predicted protein [Nematostella vectensis]|uniref:ZP domain-containing protein n=2 Tax=Nematostella vectensis TaxID=45351 RepID=A7S0C9_NEMVE|nr:predicted protein [Nematostella vectensis]|eukprot:XP_001634876.1 predicted protein [Nematostella vectensis]